MFDSFHNYFRNKSDIQCFCWTILMGFWFFLRMVSKKKTPHIYTTKDQEKSNMNIVKAYCYTKAKNTYKISDGFCIKIWLAYNKTKISRIMLDYFSNGLSFLQLTMVPTATWSKSWLLLSSAHEPCRLHKGDRWFNRICSKACQTGFQSKTVGLQLSETWFRCISLNLIEVRKFTILLWMCLFTFDLIHSSTCFWVFLFLTSVSCNSIQTSCPSGIFANARHHTETWCANSIAVFSPGRAIRLARNGPKRDPASCHGKNRHGTWVTVPIPCGKPQR